MSWNEKLSVITFISDYPWLASLSYDSNGENIYCGASIISKQWLLTSASCMKKRKYSQNVDDWTATAGSKMVKANILDKLKAWYENVFNYRRREGIFNIDVDLIILHPQYSFNDRNSLYDIALIKLKEALPLGYMHNAIVTISSISLAEGPGPDIPKYAECYMLGWGCTDSGDSVLKQAKETKSLKINDQLCETLKTDTNQTICAEYNTNIGTCGAYRGSPLVCRHHSAKWTQVGVGSKFHSDIFEQDYTSFAFTRVSFYTDWIKQTLKEELRSENPRSVV